MRLSVNELKRRAKNNNIEYKWPEILDAELKAYSETDFSEQDIKQTVDYVRGCQVAMQLDIVKTLNELGCPHAEYVRVLLAYAQNGGRITTDEVRLIARQQCLLKLDKEHFDQYIIKNEMYSDDTGAEQPWIYFTLCGSNEVNNNDEMVLAAEQEYESYVRCKISRHTGCVQYLAIKDNEHFACRKDNLLIIIA